MLFFVMTTPTFADILLPPKEQAKENARLAKVKQEYEERRARCPRTKPLYFDGDCYSCDTDKELRLGRDHVERCEDLCPNRKIFQVNPEMARFSPLLCLLQEQYVQAKQQQESGRRAREQKLYMQDKLQQERDEAAEKCGCPESHPIYGRKQGRNGQVIERCYSCRSPNKLPRTQGDRMCRDVRSVEFENDGVSEFTRLNSGETSDRSTRPCGKSKKAKSTKHKADKTQNTKKLSTNL